MEKRYSLWSPKEDKLIMDKSYSSFALAKMLPHRSPSAIRSRRSTLDNPDKRRTGQRKASKDYYGSGPKAAQSRLWTPEEDKIILDPNAPSDKELAYQLNRSIKAIEKRRWKLKK